MRMLLHLVLQHAPDEGAMGQAEGDGTDKMRQYNQSTGKVHAEVLQDLIV